MLLQPSQHAAGSTVSIAVKVRSIQTSDICHTISIFPWCNNNTQFPPFLVNALGASQAQEYAALSSICRTAYIEFLGHFIGKPPEFEEWVVIWNTANSEKASCMSKFHADLEAAAMNFADIDIKQRGEPDTPGAMEGKRR